MKNIKLRIKVFFVPLTILISLFSACAEPLQGDEENNDRPLYELTLIDSYPLAFGDPSGLAMDPDSIHLWSVNDNTGGGIYKITRTGEIVRHVPMDSDDLEGIIVDPRDSTLWVVEERLREIVNISLDGEELNRVKLDITATNPNDGLEGITVNPFTNHFYVVNEQRPRLLIELNPDMEIIKQTEIDFSGDFRMGDLSAISYNHLENTLWILSDQSEKIVVTTIDGEPLRVYITGVNDGEGLVVIPEEGIVFVASDDERELYLFEYELPEN